MLSLAIVVSIQTVGNILVLAMLVTPAATARLLTERLVPMTLLSAGIGAASGIGGLYVSYHYAVSSGASVVLTATIIFLAVFLFSHTHRSNRGSCSPAAALSPPRARFFSQDARLKRNTRKEDGGSEPAACRSVSQP